VLQLVHLLGPDAAKCTTAEAVAAGVLDGPTPCGDGAPGQHNQQIRIRLDALDTVERAVR
jgi:hypothetical protein